MSKAECRSPEAAVCLVVGQVERVEQIFSNLETSQVEKQALRDCVESCSSTYSTSSTKFLHLHQLSKFRHVKISFTSTASKLY
jgi:hypothetical protein